VYTPTHRKDVWNRCHALRRLRMTVDATSGAWGDP
jgi:hypothetical protein